MASLVWVVLISLLHFDIASAAALNDVSFVTPNQPVCINVLLNDIGEYDVVSSTNGQGWSALNFPAFYWSNSSITVFEAENYHGGGNRTGPGYTSAGDNYYWLSTPDYEDFSGVSALLAWPNSVLDTGTSSYGSANAYNIVFQNSGSYYVWLRAKNCANCQRACPTCGSNSLADDSCHLLYLAPGTSQPVLLTQTTPLSGAKNAWSWIGPVPLNIINPTTGFPYPVHTIFVAMREDGFMYDRIMIVNSPTLVNTTYGTAIGPASTPQLDCVTNNVVYWPPPAFTGTDTIQYSVSGGSPASATIDLYIGITPPSPSASISPTSSPSTTPGFTPSVTPSRTPTPSTTPSSSATPTVTPSRTPSMSVSPTSSATPSVTSSSSPSTSVTPSRTATPSSTPTTSPSISPNPSPIYRNKNDKSSNVVPYAAGIGGGLVFIALVAGAFVFYRRRTRKLGSEELIDFGMASSSIMKPLDIYIKDIKIQERLGGGKFGDVYKAIWNGMTTVAAKELKEGGVSKDFENETALLMKLNHPNIVRFLGIYQATPNIYLITEYCAQGSLLEFLRRENQLRVSDCLNLCVQIAAGCNYLEQKKIVHRDLSARNILVVNVDGKYTAKIADLGMSREIENTDLYLANNTEGMFPVRWSPPEVLEYQKFSHKSDVWSYGVVSWEIFEKGKQPYVGMSNAEVIKFVLAGNRLSQPVSCPAELFQVILKCWHEIPEQRPDFREIFDQLGKIQRGSVAPSALVTSSPLKPPIKTTVTPTKNTVAPIKNTTTPVKPTVVPLPQPPMNVPLPLPLVPPSNNNNNNNNDVETNNSNNQQVESDYHTTQTESDYHTKQ